MEKPRSPLEIVQAFIEGQITEQTYFNMRKDSSGRDILDWPEIHLLKENMDLFREYLLSFSLQGRIKILLRREWLGMTQTSLYDKYGIPKDSIRILKGQHQSSQVNKKVEIRPIKASQDISNELLANLAVFAKVPRTWLQYQKPKLSWTVCHFKDIHDAFLSYEQFHAYLIQTEKKAVSKWNNIQHTRPNTWIYDIRGVILPHNIYIRVAILEFGGFIIEIFSVDNPLRDFSTLKAALKPFEPLQVGFIPTFVKGHFNIVIVAKGKGKDYHVPEGFQTFNY